MVRGARARRRDPPADRPEPAGYAGFVALRRRPTSSPPPTTQLTAKMSSARVPEPVNASALVVAGAAVVDVVGSVVPSATTGDFFTVVDVVDAVDELVGSVDVDEP
jgi:hypothetical protein